VRTLCVSGGAKDGVYVATPAAPSNVTPPTITGTPTSGQVLTAHWGKWSSLETLTYTVQWQRCNAAGQDCANIVGATHANYKATSADVGDELTTVVTATDQQGQSTQATAAPIGPVAAG
jgi:hypothetical protein